MLPLFETRGIEVDAEEREESMPPAEARHGLVAVAEAGGGEAGPVLRLGDIATLLKLQAQQMEAKWAELRQAFPPAEGGALISAGEAVLCGTVQHFDEVLIQYAQGVGYVPPSG